MKEISMDSIICQRPDVVATSIDGEVVMMSIENGAYYGLDFIASRIWELIASPCQVAKLIETLMLDFEVERSSCERDVVKFLQELQKDKVIQVQ